MRNMQPEPALFGSVHFDPIIMGHCTACSAPDCLDLNGIRDRSTIQHVREICVAKPRLLGDGASAHPRFGEF